MPVPTCTVDVADTSKPDGSSYAYCLAAEIRALKAALAALSSNGYQLITEASVSAAASWSNTTLASGGWKDIKCLVSLTLSVDATLLLRFNNKSGAIDYSTTGIKAQAAVLSAINSTGTSILLSANANIDSTAQIEGSFEVNNINSVKKHNVNGQITFKNDSLQNATFVLAGYCDFTAEALNRIDIIPGGVATMTGKIVLLGRK